MLFGQFGFGQFGDFRAPCVRTIDALRPALSDRPFPTILAILPFDLNLDPPNLDLDLDPDPHFPETFTAPRAMLSTPTAESAESSLASPLERLPDFGFTEKGCPRRARTQIDLTLLAIEALNLKGTHDILSLAKQLELSSVLPNRVTLWRIRNTNPLRRFSRRRPMRLEEAKALATIACHIARRLNIVIRQLLAEAVKLRAADRPYSDSPHLARYLERFRAHFRSRMNARRAAIALYDTSEKLDDLAIDLLGKLLFCTGTAGLQRFWTSLFNGEIS